MEMGSVNVAAAAAAALHMLCECLKCTSLRPTILFLFYTSAVNVQPVNGALSGGLL